MTAPTHDAPGPPLAGQWIREEYLESAIRDPQRGRWEPRGLWHLATGDLAWRPKWSEVHVRPPCGVDLILEMVRGDGLQVIRLTRADTRPARSWCQRCDFTSDLSEYSDPRGREAVLPLLPARARTRP